MKILNEKFKEITYEISKDKVILSLLDNSSLETSAKSVNRFLAGAKVKQSAKVSKNTVIVDVESLVEYALDHMFY